MAYSNIFGGNVYLSYPENDGNMGNLCPNVILIVIVWQNAI